MTIARINATLTAATDMPWAKDFRFWKGATKGDPLNVTSAIARVRLRGCEAPPAFVLTEVDGQVFIQNNIVTLRLSVLDMEQIGVGSFDLEVTATLEDGSGRRLIVALDVSGPI
jgi:hypothetical protein